MPLCDTADTVIRDGLSDLRRFRNPSGLVFAKRLNHLLLQNVT